MPARPLDASARRLDTPARRLDASARSLDAPARPKDATARPKDAPARKQGVPARCVEETARMIPRMHKVLLKSAESLNAKLGFQRRSTRRELALPMWNGVSTRMRGQFAGGRMAVPDGLEDLSGWRDGPAFLMTDAGCWRASVPRAVLRRAWRQPDPACGLVDGAGRLVKPAFRHGVSAWLLGRVSG